MTHAQTTEQLDAIISEQVTALAIEYLNCLERKTGGTVFEAYGVGLPLDLKLLEIGIHNNVVGALLSEFGRVDGREKALLMLSHMNSLYGITKLGIDMLNELHSGFCKEVAEQLKAGTIDAFFERGVMQ